jgi:hypothetical protein
MKNSDFSIGAQRSVCNKYLGTEKDAAKKYRKKKCIIQTLLVIADASLSPVGIDARY